MGVTVCGSRMADARDRRVNPYRPHIDVESLELPEAARDTSFTYRCEVEVAIDE